MLLFGIEPMTLLANHKREREAGTNRQAAWQMMQVASAGDSVSGLIDDSAAASWALWASGLHTRFQGAAIDFPYRANVNALLVGAERISPAGHTLGFAVGYDHVNADLTYQSSFQDGDEKLAVLYGAYMLDQRTSIDAAVSGSGTSVTRRAQVIGGEADGGFSGHRTTESINLNRVFDAGAVTLTAHTGFLATQEVQPAFAESGAGTTINVDREQLTVSQINAAIEAACPLWSRGEVFGSAAYRYDLHRSDDDLIKRGANGDVSDYELLLGGRHRVTDSLTLSASASKILARRGYRSDTVQLTLRWEP
ncbi:MAG: autotransporter outer membrane beta-barrel domain-containing protein [Stenotrophobium sp.]